MTQLLQDKEIQDKNCIIVNKVKKNQDEVQRITNERHQSKDQSIKFCKWYEYVGEDEKTNT